MDRIEKMKSASQKDVYVRICIDCTAQHAPLLIRGPLIECHIVVIISALVCVQNGLVVFDIGKCAWQVIKRCPTGRVCVRCTIFRCLFATNNGKFVKWSWHLRHDLQSRANGISEIDYFRKGEKCGLIIINSSSKRPIKKAHTRQN